MQTLAIVIFFIIALLAGAIFIVSRRSGFRRWKKAESLPEELAQSKLWASEKEIACRRPMRLRGRVDQVYRTRQGHLVPVDTKRRSRDVVYLSDRLQLSLYRVILMHRPLSWLFPVYVAEYGYIRLVTPDGVKYQRTALLPLEEVTAYYNRYLDVLSGKVEPTLTKHTGICNQCAWRPDCPRYENRSVMSKIRRSWSGLMSNTGKPRRSETKEQPSPTTWSL